MTRALIVDDKEENLYYLQALLAGHGFAVDTARHGAEALVKARQRPPDLIISDLLMPVMDGYTLLRHWKADERLKRIPFIVYTATYTEAEDERLALSLGADAFILKPAEPEEFLARIRDVQTRVAQPGALPLNKPVGEETEILKVYSETLIRKLEEKMLLLEEANRALEQDIAERRKMEEALRAGEQEQRQLARQLEIERARLAAAQQVAKVGSWETDITSLAVVWSEETHRIFGTDPATFTPTHRNFLEFVHPDDRAAVNEAFVRSLDQRQTCVIEHRIVPADGGTKYVEERWQVFRDAEDKPARTLGTCRDITEKRLAELEARRTTELLRAVADGSPDAIFVKDLQGRYLLFNEGAARLVGRGVEEVLGRDDTYIFGPEDARLVLETDRRVIESNRAQTSEEVLTAAGVTRTYLATKAPYRNAEGKVVGVVGISRDISERKRVQQQIADAQRFSQTLIETSPLAIITYKATGEAVTANPASMKMLGAPSVAAVQAQNFRQIESWKRTGLLAAADAALASGQPREMEIKTVNTFGREIWLHCRLVPFKFGDGQYLLGFFDDIRERKLAEEKLLAGEETQRRLAEAQTAILNALPAHIALVNAEGVIVSVNESWRRFATANVLQGPEFGLGQNYIEVCERARGDCSEEARVAADGIRRVLRGEARGFAIEYPCHSPTQQRWFRLMVTPLREDLRIGAVVMHLDITERHLALDRLRESEERFRELAETVQEVFWITDPAKSRMLYVSPAYEKVWGRTCASLYESPRTWLDAIHPEDRERITHAAETRQTRGDYDETYRIQRPDGVVRWIHDRAFPVRGAAGEVVRVVGTAEDITNRRQLEEQFRQAQKMEAIGQLAAGVAHDFNNILAAIIGNTQLALADVAEGHPARESLEEIKRASVRATSLVQQILAFSRQQTQERRVIELGSTVQETVKFLRATIPSAVELDVSIDADTPPVLADPTQIHQVVANLCTNAWHALEDRPGRIAVRLQPVILDAAATGRLAGLKPGRVACLSVIDTGQGMDAATLERIFDPFFTTKEPGKGTGLGLSVVHGIVQAHDGAITVTSQPGRGTHFEVYFPAATAPVEAAAPVASAPQRGEGQRILYLDDEAPLVFLAERMLALLGYRVTGFTRATDAAKAFRDNPGQFDLVITDLNMPGVSGLNVATDFLKLRPDVPVVLCSGHVTEDLKQRARAAGIREVLYKPNTMEEFSEAIHRLAARTRQP